MFGSIKSFSCKSIRLDGRMLSVISGYVRTKSEFGVRMQSLWTFPLFLRNVDSQKISTAVNRRSFNRFESEIFYF